jgi:hypothetical protein
VNTNLTTKLKNTDTETFVTFALSFENTGRRGPPVSLKQNPSMASFQHGVLESRLTWTFPDASVQIWMPAIHAGMTKICIFMFYGERKVMNNFVVKNFVSVRGMVANKFAQTVNQGGFREYSIHQSSYG